MSAARPAGRSPLALGLAAAAVLAAGAGIAGSLSGRTADLASAQPIHCGDALPPGAVSVYAPAAAGAVPRSPDYYYRRSGYTGTEAPVTYRGVTYRRAFDVGTRRGSETTVLCAPSFDATTELYVLPTTNRERPIWPAALGGFVGVGLLAPAAVLTLSPGRAAPRPPAA